MKRLFALPSLLLIHVYAFAQQGPGGMMPQLQQQPPQGPPPLPHPELPPPPPVPDHVSGLMVLGTVVLLGLVVTGLILLLFGRKKAGPTPTKRPIKETLRALKDLRSKADVMKPAAVGHAVSEILRRFYEARYGIPAPYKTTQELFPQVELSKEPLRRRLWRERYEPLAAIYDELSYAPVPATATEALALIDAAIRKLEDERLNEDPRAN